MQLYLFEVGNVRTGEPILAYLVRTTDGKNVLIDTGRVPELLAQAGVEAAVEPSFGGEELPAGLVAIVGRRTA